MPSTCTRRRTRLATKGMPKLAPKAAARRARLRSRRRRPRAAAAGGCGSRSAARAAPASGCTPRSVSSPLSALTFGPSKREARGHEAGHRIGLAGQQVALPQPRVEGRHAGVDRGGGDAQRHPAAGHGAVQLHIAVDLAEAPAQRRGAEVQHLEVHEAVLRVEPVDHRLGASRSRCGQPSKPAGSSLMPAGVTARARRAVPRRGGTTA